MNMILLGPFHLLSQNQNHRLREKEIININLFQDYHDITGVDD